MRNKKNKENKFVEFESFNNKYYTYNNQAFNNNQIKKKKAKVCCPPQENKSFSPKRPEGEGTTALLMVLATLYGFLCFEAPEVAIQIFVVALLIFAGLVVLGFLKALFIVEGRLIVWLISGLFRGFRL